MKSKFNFLYEARTFLVLWLTQSFSALGSAMTGYALVIWSYQQKGSALATSLLMVCSYAPYVLLSIFAGALSDRLDKKKIMLGCDAIAAMGTVTILVLMKTGNLELWHLYLLNALNGFMNTIQQPASDVATSLVLPKKYYQKVGGLRYLSNSVNSILTTVIATAFVAFAGIDFVLFFDLGTFAVAFVTLLIFIKIPEAEKSESKKETFFESAKTGLSYLMQNRGIFDLIIFLAFINLTASLFEAAFPAMILSRSGGGETVLGTVNAFRGVTMLVGSFIASAFKKPKNRVKVICYTLLFSMSFENFMLAFGRNVWVWCGAEFLGWILIPLMSTNLDAIMRENVPVEIQGRVFSARNILQFFTIPVGYFFGGFFVDKVYEPFMSTQKSGSFFIKMFGSGKGSGAAFFFFTITFLGIFT